MRSRGHWKRLRWELYLFGSARSMDIGVNVDKNEDQVQFFAAIRRLFSLYVTVRVPFARADLEHSSRELSLSFHHGKIWVTLWGDGHAGFGPRRKLVIDPSRILRGRSRITSTPMHTINVVLPLPEGDLPATIAWKRYEERWSRWPVKRRWLGYELTPSTPVVVPGDGENDWDLGDDAYYCQAGRAETLDPAPIIERFVNLVIETRQRHW